MKWKPFVSKFLKIVSPLPIPFDTLLALSHRLESGNACKSLILYAFHICSTIIVNDATFIVGMVLHPRQQKEVVDSFIMSTKSEFTLQTYEQVLISCFYPLEGEYYANRGHILRHVMIVFGRMVKAGVLPRQQLHDKMMALFKSFDVDAASAWENKFKEYASLSLDQRTIA